MTGTTVSSRAVTEAIRYLLFELAESFEQQKKSDMAYLACRNYVLRYPSGKRADSALFALGNFLSERGEREKAKRAFMQIVLFYPYSNVYEEAKQRLDQIVRPAESVEGPAEESR